MAGEQEYRYKYIICEIQHARYNNFDGVKVNLLMDESIKTSAEFWAETAAIIALVYCCECVESITIKKTLEEGAEKCYLLIDFKM